jgi:ribonucleoside-diphosphate reductase alpha chain
MAKIDDNTKRILQERYYYKDMETGKVLESTPEEMFRRVAKAVVQAEYLYPKTYITESPKLLLQQEEKFFEAMNLQRFLPNTPTLISAGYKNKTLAACSVIGAYPDSLEGIYQYLWKNALLTKWGAGVGQSLSKIRPKGEIIKSSGGLSAGSTNWLKLISASSSTTIQGDKSRRAANMVSQRFSHPDIFDFINAKEKDGDLIEMNMSVVITDKEMEAVINDTEINLEWGGKVYKTVKAREIFNQIMDGMHKSAEPGILFIDTINKDNPFNVGGVIAEGHEIEVTNPCGRYLPHVNHWVKSVEA